MISSADLRKLLMFITTYTEVITLYVLFILALTNHMDFNTNDV